MRFPMVGEFIYEPIKPFFFFGREKKPGGQLGGGRGEKEGGGNEKINKQINA